MIRSLQHSAAVVAGFIPALTATDKIQSNCPAAATDKIPSKYHAAARTGINPAPVDVCNTLIINVLPR